MKHSTMKDTTPMMKLLLIACLAALALSACEQSKDASAPAPAPAAAPAPSATVPAPAASRAQTPAPIVAPTYEFAFTFQGSEGTQDPRILRYEDGPCGGTPVAKVASIPLTDANLLPDFVVEFDSTGKEIKRWGKPYEAEVIGLDGDRLQFRTSDDHAFWTDTTGAIGALDSAPTAELDAPLIECPELPTFAKSEYEQCYGIAGIDGPRRTLAWEGVCT